MAEWQGWAGLLGIAFLIFDRASGGFGWLFGRTSTEANLKRDADEFRKDFDEHCQQNIRVIDHFNQAASKRNSELQRIIGHIELALVEHRKDIETLRRDVDSLKYGS